MPTLLTQTQVCEILGISKRTLNRMDHTNTFEVTWVSPGSKRYSKTSVEKYLKSRTIRAMEV